MTCHCRSFCRLSAAALLTAALLILLSFTESDLARLAGPVPVAAVTLSGDGGKWVVINRKGERQGTGAYVYAGGFSEGLAAVCDGTAWGYVDTKGKIAIPCKFSRAGEFHEGFAPVKTTGRSVTGGDPYYIPDSFTDAVDPELKGGWRYINEKGEFAFDGVFDYAAEFRYGYGPVIIHDEEHSVTSTGEILVGPPRHKKGTHRPRNTPEPVSDDASKWGYKLGGNWLVEPRFQSAREFSDGMAAVQENDKWGFVDLTGKIVIEPDFEGVGSFSEGRAAVKEHSKWGYIDKTGDLVIPPEFDRAEQFRNGIAVVTSGAAEGAVNLDGKLVIPCSYAWVSFGSGHYQDPLIAVTRIGESLGYVRADGTVICEPIFEEAGWFSKGYACVKENGSWNVIDENLHRQYDIPLDEAKLEYGEWVKVRRGGKAGWFNMLNGARTEIIYDEVEGWSCDFLVGTRGGRKWMIREADCRETGKSFEDLLYVGDDGFFVKDGGLWGFVDRNLDMLIAPAYTDVTDSYGGSYAVKTLAGWGYADRSGRAIITPKYAEVMRFDGDSTMVRLQPRTQVQLADAYGRLIGEVFDSIGAFGQGLAPVCRNGKWGFADTQGRVAILLQFDAAGAFCGGLAPVCVGNRWGYIGLSGDNVIECRYDSAESFSEGLGVVTRDGKTLFIDKTGTPVLGPFDYPAVGFKDGVAWLSDAEGRWAPINHEGKAIREPVQLSRESVLQWRMDWYPYSVGPGFEPALRYTSLEPASDRLIRFWLHKDFESLCYWGAADIEGHVIVPPIYTGVGNCGCGLFCASGESSDMLLRRDGSVAFGLPAGCRSAGGFCDGWMLVTRDEMYNYVDAGGRFISPDWFSFARSFSEGLGLVCAGGQCGFVDTAGQVFFVPSLERFSTYSSGLVVGKTADGWTAVDRDGVAQFPPIRDEIGDFHGNYAACRFDDGCLLIDRSGKPVPLRCTVVGQSAATGEVIDLTGAEQKFYVRGVFPSGLAVIQENGGNDLFAVAIGSARARRISEFPWGDQSGDVAPLVARAVAEEGEWGALGTDLAWVVPPVFDELERFSQGLAFARKDGVSGYVDEKGNWAFTLAMTSGWPFSDGVALVETKQGDTWINRQGKKAVLADAETEDGRYAALRGGCVGFFDRRGNIAIPAWFTNARAFTEGLTAVSDLRHRWGFINQTGEYVIVPQFGETGDFSEGLAAVLVGDKQNGLWTFIDRKGRQIHEPYFDEVRAFHQGLAAVRRGALWGYMDKHGQMVFPLQFNSAGDFVMEK
ncbi:MAG: WG repeat-containing protein [Candidatus Brocadiia bacterium]